MGMGTSGLGGMRFQEMPSLILKMMLSIGVFGDIIPNEYNDVALGNLLEVIMISGFKLLDLYFNLSRSQINKRTHLPAIAQACEGKYSLQCYIQH